MSKLQRYRGMAESALAMRDFSVAEQEALAGGGRLRPILVLAWCEKLGGSAVDALGFAVAVELLHTMSLIHDDLPCMDNADERRGRASCHSAYGEAVAVLTGDALLARAFRALTEGGASRRCLHEAVRILCTAAQDMAKGQILEREQGGTDEVNRLKTASLIECACKLGALAGGGSCEDLRAAEAYGRSLGMAYQLCDDLRDGDGAAVTKGPEKARAELEAWLAQALMRAGDCKALRELVEGVKP